MRTLLWMILFSAALLAVRVNSAQAATYDIQELTPPVKAALDNRRARFNELKAYKAQGVIGENNQGYVELLSGDTTARAMVEAENADRRVIYQAIVQQNGLAPELLATVEKTFAQVQRDKAASGDKVQDQSGSWGTK